MSTITLNGVESSTITGLLILTQPPIVKPLQRTMIEEVDGRDGDIITKLGYSAYDVEIQIGLHKNFDINQVISFFDSEGTVVFSQEPDKYYYYSILDEIDYERLIRFRTAKVKFHLQPFKYKLNEADVTQTGNPVTSVSVTNSGNTTAKPTLIITGSGTITVSLNTMEVFNIDMTGISSIKIDTSEMNAYSGTDYENFANRQVQGQYSAFVLRSGSNSITFSGSVTEVVVQNYSRWI